MNNYDAYDFYLSNSDRAFYNIVRECISKYHLDESDFDYFRRKFTQIKQERTI